MESGSYFGSVMSCEIGFMIMMARDSSSVGSVRRMLLCSMLERVDTESCGE